MPPEQVYDAEYFKKYQQMADTKMGRDITRFRVEFVEAYIKPSELVLDIGIGSGQFVETRPETYGYDVNPAGVRWLLDRGSYADPYTVTMPGFVCGHMTFFDSFEHIREPGKLLAKIEHTAVISLPVFAGADHVLRSRHFRKDEHYHYFTTAGLLDYMRAQGFQMVGWSDKESKLGRDGVETFAFKRIIPACCFE